MSMRLWSTKLSWLGPTPSLIRLMPSLSPMCSALYVPDDRRPWSVIDLLIPQSKPTPPFTALGPSCTNFLALHHLRATSIHTTHVLSHKPRDMLHNTLTTRIMDFLSLLAHQTDNNRPPHHFLLASAGMNSDSDGRFRSSSDYQFSHSRECSLS